MVYVRQVQDFGRNKIIRNSNFFFYIYNFAVSKFLRGEGETIRLYIFCYVLSKCIMWILGLRVVNNLNSPTHLHLHFKAFPRPKTRTWCWSYTKARIWYLFFFLDGQLLIGIVSSSTINNRVIGDLWVAVLPSFQLKVWLSVITVSSLILWM